MQRYARLGCILATVALRYHYVVDVVASVALFPVLAGAGIALHRAWEGRGAGAAAPDGPPPTSSPP